MQKSAVVRIAGIAGMFTLLLLLGCGGSQTRLEEGTAGSSGGSVSGGSNGTTTGSTGSTTGTSGSTGSTGTGSTSGSGGTTGGTPPAPSLTVSGNQIRYNNQSITLRGVGVGDVIANRSGRPASDYQSIASTWNCNVARLDVSSYYWNHQPAEVLAALKREVDAALAAHLFVIIDWHVIGWPNGMDENTYYQLGLPYDFYDTKMSTAIDFWTRISGLYGSDGRILFEIWNEPVQLDKSAPTASPSRWQYLKPYLQQITDAIRAKSQNVILATGDGWAYNMQGIKSSPLPDANTAYTWHIYAGHDGNNTDLWAKKLDELQTAKPVVVSEWGFERDAKRHYKGTAETFGIPFMQGFLKGRNLHSTAWAWSANIGPAMLTNDWITPTEYGLFVKQYLVVEGQLVRP